MNSLALWSFSSFISFQRILLAYFKVFQLVLELSDLITLDSGYWVSNEPNFSGTKVDLLTVQLPKERKLASLVSTQANPCVEESNTVMG